MGLTLIRALSFVLAFLALNVGCARIPPPAPPRPDIAVPVQPGALFLADGRQLAASDLAALVSSHDFILIGESHANACDHLFQADSLAALAQSGLPLRLGLEMVPWSAQPTLEAFYNGEIVLDELEEQLGWSDYWGFNFDLYRPILTQAEQLDIPMIGLNVPKDLLQRIRAAGLESIRPDERGLLPPELIPPPPQQRAMIEEEYQRHVELMPDRTMEAGFELDRFMMIQSLWDTQMAHTAIQQRRGPEETVIILTGSAHVAYGHGISHRLSLLDDTAKILSILPWRGGPAPDPASGDLFYFCPEPPQRLGMVIAWVGDQAVVSNVLRGSLAEQAGLLPGDVLITAGETPVISMESLHLAGIQARAKQRPLRLEVLRNETRLSVTVFFP